MKGIKYRQLERRRRRREEQGYLKVRKEAKGR
jgi:hypothetical protein